MKAVLQITYTDKGKSYKSSAEFFSEEGGMTGHAG